MATSWQAATLGQKLSTIGHSSAALLGGTILGMEGLRRGGVSGLAMTTAGRRADRLQVRRVDRGGYRRLCRRYQVKELAVFGSATPAARCVRTVTSNLLVEFLPEAEVSLLQHLAAERELSTLLGRKVDLVSKRALRSTLRDEVLSNARVVYAA